MRGLKALITVAGIFVSVTLLANTDRQLWFAFLQQGRISKHWGYWVDLQHRTKNNFASNLHTELFRAGGTYFINDQWRITLGYAYIMHFPSVTNQSFLRQEHRPWQQVFHTATKGSFRVAQYLRSEQRLMQKTMGETIVDGFVFRQRVRYNVNFMVLFNKSKAYKQNSVGLSIGNELFVNAYSADKVNWYDQNRAFAGLFYNITDALQLHLGYLNVFSKTAKGNEVVHAIRLAALHSIDWRKKK